MLSVILALALAQPILTPASACATNRLCRPSRVNIVSSSATTTQQCWANPTSAVSVRRNSQFMEFGVGGSCAAGFTSFPLYFDTTSLATGLGASYVLRIDGTSSAVNMPTPSYTARGLGSDANRLMQSDGNAWTDVGTGAHPVLDRRTWTTESDAAAGVRWFNAGVPRIRHTLWNLATVGTFVVSPVNTGLLITGQRGGATVRVEDVPWTTGAVANDRAGWFNAGALGMPHSRRFKICQPVGALSASTSIRIVIGQAVSTLFTAPSDNPVNAGAWIRFSSAAGDTNFMLCTSDGAAAATCTSTGVPPSTSAGVGSVVCVDQLEGSAVTAWVDGRARVRVTTNITTSDATTGSFGVIAQTLTAATRTVSFGHMSLEASP